MTTAEATRDEVRRGEDRPTPAQSARVPPKSPVLSLAWLLRATALASVAAGLIGTIVAPGIRGNAGEGVVVWVDRASAAFAYFLLGLLAALAGRGAFELVRAHALHPVVRVMLIS